MFSFILKGILRDRSRSLFPVIIVAAGVLIIVFTLAFMQGYTVSMIRQNARFETGHVKIVTNAYAELITQKPYDLGLLDVGEELKQWQDAYPELSFVQRINFVALLDIPDSDGNTRAQGDVIGFALELLTDGADIKNMNLQEGLVRGKIPTSRGEILLSETAYQRLSLAIGDTITLIGSTIYGAMAIQNFELCGTLNFGYEAMDRGGVIADISDIQHFLDMEDGAGEILGFFTDGKYSGKRAEIVKTDFNNRFSDPLDEYAPVMLGLEDQNNMKAILKMMDLSLGIMTMVFIAIMGIVLWNSGLMNGIRRYGEIGVRLAMGEEKKHLYAAMIIESVFVGIIGSLIGTVLGLLLSWYFNIFGLDVGAYNRESAFLSENVVYTAIDIKTSLWGFIPGVLATMLGAMLAGLVIFKRKTSQLFKELEV